MNILEALKTGKKIKLPEMEEFFDPRKRLYGIEFIEREDWQTEKKLVRKEVRVWMNIYPRSNYCFHSTKKEADREAVSDRIACVELVGHYEVGE